MHSIDTLLIKKIASLRNILSYSYTHAMFKRQSHFCPHLHSLLESPI